VSVLERWDAEEGTDRIDQYFATTEPEKKEATPAAS
jgi:SulP family sulfate permease